MEDKEEKLKNSPVYQSNPLLQARKHYGILEHRLFRLALADLKPHLKNAVYYDKEIRPFHMSTYDVVELFGRSNKRIYEQLRKACRKMFDSKIEMGDERKFKLVHFFDEISFDTESGLDIYFSPKVKDILIELEKGNYTRVMLGLSFALSSSYSLILLELMLQYSGRKKDGVIERTLMLEELRFSLDISDDAYKGRMNNFRSRVIDPAIKEINEKTSYFIDPEYKMIRGEHNKVKGFQFTLHLPKEGDESEKEELPMELLVPGSSDDMQSPEEREIIERLAKYEIVPQTALKLLEEFGAERIDVNLKFAYAHKYGKENLGGWVIDCIRNNRAADAKEAKKIAGEREKSVHAKELERFLADQRERDSIEISPLPEDSPFKKFERKKVDTV